MSRLGQALGVALLCMLAACSKGSTPPSPPPSGGTGDTITGRERIGWDQQAESATELATFRYVIYVDGVRSELTDVSCGTTAGAAGFPCSARLPPMSNGSHVLELASLIELDGIVESSRSAQIRVTVAAVAPGTDRPLVDGEIVTTADGVQLRAEFLLDGLSEAAALAVARDGRAFIGGAGGLIVLKGGEPIGGLQLADGPVLAIALSPDFDRDSHVYVTQSLASDSDGPRFRISRYLDFGNRLVQRMVVLESGPASADPRAVIGFGPDAKLYAAFDDGGSQAASERMSEWSGKVLRMEPDGHTPHDQPAASPVLVGGLTSPRGFDWTPDGSAIWLADASRDGIERLRVITTTSVRPRRAGQRGTFTLPRGIGAAALAFHRGEAIRAFAGDLLVAGRDGGYILRIRFAPDDPSRPASSERLLEGRAGSIRTLTVGHDGAIYFCADGRLVRLTSVDSR